MSTPLQIVVTGDVKSANASLESVQAELAKVAVSAQKTDSSLQSFGKKLSDSGSGLSKLKAQLPNVGSAISDVSSEFAGFGSLLGGGVIAGIVIAVKLFDTWAHSLSDTQKAQRALNDSLADSKASVAGEVSALTSLVAIARDTTLSYQARQQAIDKINKDYPAHLGFITQENINTDKVRAAIDAETASLIRRAQIKGAENLISKETENLLKAQTELTIDNTTVWDKFVAVIHDALNPGTGSTELVTRAVDNQAEAAKSAITAIEVYKGKLKELLTASAEAGDLFTPKPHKDKIAKAARETAEVYTETLQHALAEIFAKGFKEAPDPFAGLKKSSLGKISPTEGMAQAIKDLVKGFAEADAAQAILQKHLDDTAKTVTDIVAPAFDTMFKSILDGSKNVLQSLGQLLADVVKRIAEAVLKAAALAAIMTLIFPGSTLGKKGFFGALGSLLGFAGGVTNFQGGVALVGEKGPEIVTLPRGSNVIPNNQIASAGMIGAMDVFVHGEVQGSNLLIVMDRAIARRSRNG